MQSGLSSILLRRPHFHFWGEAKGLWRYFDGVSYGDRGLLRSLCPYGERCIGWFSHNGNSLQAKASYNLLGRPLLLPDNLFDFMPHLRVEFARIITPFLAFRGICLRLPTGISSARGLIPSNLSRDSTSGHSNGFCDERGKSLLLRLAYFLSLFCLTWGVSHFVESFLHFAFLSYSLLRVNV